MKDKMFTIRCNESLLMHIDYLCKEFKCSQSHLIDTLVCEFNDTYLVNDDKIRNNLYKYIVKSLNR